MFYYILVYTVASIDTRCIDSKLESGRYISRVGRASKFLSLRGYRRYMGMYLRERNLLALPTLGMYLPLSNI